MAKLKYDRPINMRLTNSARVTIPDGEVWKVTTGALNNESATTTDNPRTNLYGGVHLQRGLQSATDVYHRRRLQDHQRVSDSMEVVLHG